MANITYRQATMADADAIWQIISDAKAVMSIDHNPQWDNGYQSPEIIKADIAKGTHTSCNSMMKLSPRPRFGKKKM